MTQDTPQGIRCLVSHPDLDDGDRWTAEAIDEINAAELGERIIAWARENPGEQVILKSQVVDRERYDALGREAGA